MAAGNELAFTTRSQECHIKTMTKVNVSSGFYDSNKMGTVGRTSLRHGLDLKALLRFLFRCAEYEL